MTRCQVRCCICGTEMDFHRAYGRVATCCGKQCHDEFEWRRTLSIMDKPYRPDPRRFPPVEEVSQ
jgi:hypothetical protein